MLSTDFASSSVTENRFVKKNKLITCKYTKLFDW